MRAAHIALLTSVGLTPILLFFDGTWLSGLNGLFVAGTLVTLAVLIWAGEARHLVRTTRPVWVPVALPLAWLILQFFPLPLAGLSRSVWQSASGALGLSLWSPVTIDPGLSLVALSGYLSFLGIGFLAAGVLDRSAAG